MMIYNPNGAAHALAPNPNPNRTAGAEVQKDPPYATLAVTNVTGEAYRA